MFQLDEWLWGWTKGFDLRDEYRAPLPVTEDFPLFERLPGLNLPPYLLAFPLGPGSTRVLLCAGDGDGRKLHVGDPEVPEEWKEPIRQALDEIGRHWPGVPLVFKKEPDTHAQEAQA